MLMHHRLTQIKSIYKSSRAEVFWTPEEITQFEAGAPDHIARILIAATETGLRPGDLVGLSREHIHPTPTGRRIVIWTSKGKAKRRGTIQGRRKGWKKAFVCLKPGQEINFAEGGAV